MYRIGVVRASVWYDYVWGMVSLRVDWVVYAFSCVVYVVHVLYMFVHERYMVCNNYVYALYKASVCSL